MKVTVKSLITQLKEFDEDKEVAFQLCDECGEVTLGRELKIIDLKDRVVLK